MMNGNPKESEDRSVKIKNSGMYSVKRPYEISDDIQLPSIMYQVVQVKPIEMETNSETSFGSVSVSGSNHGLGGSVSRGTLTSSGGSKKVKTSTSSTMTSAASNDQITSLELRQLQIIDKLTYLREVITEIHGNCVESLESASKSSIRSGSKSVISIASASLPEQTEDGLFEETVDIVINANPSSPPYSLLFFALQLERTYKNAVVSLRSHVHSSYRETFDRKSLKDFDKVEENANLKFTIIWRDVKSCTMIISPIQSTKIEKEANIARFLSRLLPIKKNSMNYDCLNWETLVKVDSLLELENDPKVVSVVDQELQNSKGAYLAGEFSVADLVLYSCIRSKGEENGMKDFPSNVQIWVKNIDTLLDLLGMKI